MPNGLSDSRLSTLESDFLARSYGEDLDRTGCDACETDGIFEPSFAPLSIDEDCSADSESG